MNNDKNLSSVGQDILLSGRTQLCMALPYLSGELCALVPVPGDEQTVSAATDGESIYYNASFLAAGFLKSERFSPRLNMHMLGSGLRCRSRKRYRFAPLPLPHAALGPGTGAFSY